jgi:hypothetical protein
MYSRLILQLLLLIFFSTAFAQHQASFIWKDEKGLGRQQKILFRYNFELEGEPQSLDFNIFADSRYHLYINGTHINFGPSRFYTENPQYDNYELKHFLQKGKNTIAVEVLANGMNTFQLPKSIGGFIAWGSATDNTGNKININTPGKWKMLPVATMDTQAVKFSFATGALEVQNLNQQPFKWTDSGFDDSNWLRPVLIENQNHWGTLTLKEIPPLTQNEKTVFNCLGIYKEQKDETIESFYVKCPDETVELYNEGEEMLGYTYIYSPKDQDVELGTWWGDYYLNGEGPIPVSSKSKTNRVRENRVFKLKKGWNYLFVYYHALWGAWEFSVAVPKDAGLIFDADRKKNSTVFFKTLSKLNKQNAENLKSKFKSDDKGIAKINWQLHPHSSILRNPARNLAWHYPDVSENLKSNDYQVSGFKTTEPMYYIFDVGYKTLGRLFIDIVASKGTVVEFAWSENLNEDQIPDLYKRLQINSGARFITDGITTHYSTFKPYGVKYITVKIVPADNKKAVINKLGVIEQVYPYDKTGSFECSDPMFNKIWELGWRTLRVCSEDSYTDTPFRERGLYAGDALPEYAITLATSGDSRLMKKSLLLFQDMYREDMITGKDSRHNDFILNTLIELYWYYKYTGDTAFTKELYVNYKTHLNNLEEKRSDKGYYIVGNSFFEWTQIKRTADLTAYQALVYGSLKMMQEMAVDFGYTEDAAVFSERSQKIKDVIDKQFWDADKKVYFDGYENGKKINHHYPISSFYPLLFEAVGDTERKQQIIEYLDQELKDIGEKARKRKITPYGSFYLFASLYQNEEAALAERFMKQYWSRMIHQGDDTSWEDFDIGGKKDGETQGTASHAWSGHPTYFLSTEVLGVKIGFNQDFSRDTVLIQPQTESVSWARGIVPHPAGKIKIDWKIQGKNLIFNLELPKDVPYIVEPKGSLAKYNLILNTKIF